MLKVGRLVLLSLLSLLMQAEGQCLAVRPNQWFWTTGGQFVKCCLAVRPDQWVWTSKGQWLQTGDGACIQPRPDQWVWTTTGQFVKTADGQTLGCNCFGR